MDNTQATAEKKPSPFIDLLVSIVIPSIILMQLSGPERLGPTAALIFALSFPVGWGMYELLKNKKKNWVAVIGVISVLLTGGIGLLQIDSKWLAVKEAAIPAAFGIGVLIASKLGFPIVRKLLFNPAIMNTERIDAELDKKGNRSAFEKRLDNANYFFVGTFAFSAVMNYLLATWIVQSDSGTEEFNKELGRMTLMSYPVIVAPSMIMMVGIFFYIWHTANKLTGLSLEEMLVDEGNNDKQAE